tara:strand:- start:621 stop:800 length:180 start_codon:yes stop_codon:yes gene_type:complete
MKSITLYCEDCKSKWVAVRFPVSVETLELLIDEVACITCNGKNLSVFSLPEWEKSNEDI